MTLIIWRRPAVRRKLIRFTDNISQRFYHLRRAIENHQQTKYKKMTNSMIMVMAIYLMMVRVIILAGLITIPVQCNMSSRSVIGKSINIIFFFAGTEKLQSRMVIRFLTCDWLPQQPVNECFQAFVDSAVSVFPRPAYFASMMALMKK